MSEPQARALAELVAAMLTPAQKSALLRKMVAHEVGKQVRMEVITPLRRMLKHYVTELPNGER